MDASRFIVITGGPGSGKTTLLDALRESGHSAMPEAGRNIIRAQQAVDGPALPWRDPALFAELMLSWDMRSYEEAGQKSGTLFFDRGIPDTIGYLRLTSLPVPAHDDESGGNPALPSQNIHRAFLARHIRAGCGAQAIGR